MKILILTFDLRGEKWAARKKIWRMLKRVGAELEYKSHWTLSYNKKNLENFTTICSEIKRLGGKAEVIKGEKID